MLYFPRHLDRCTAGNNYYGLAIGFTVYAITVAGGSISGGAFNPAIGIGPLLMDAIIGGDGLKHAWLYFFGPVAGGFLAGIAFRIISPEDFAVEK